MIDARPTHILNDMEPIRFGLLAGGLLVAACGGSFGRGTPPEPPVIAVVRFDNRTGNADLDRFAEGLTDAVTSELATRTAPRFTVNGKAEILRRPRAERSMSHLFRLTDRKHLAMAEFVAAVDDPAAAPTKFADPIVRDLVTKLASPDEP